MLDTACSFCKSSPTWTQWAPHCKLSVVRRMEHDCDNRQILQFRAQNGTPEIAHFQHRRTHETLGTMQTHLLMVLYTFCWSCRFAHIHHIKYLCMQCHSFENKTISLDVNLLTHFAWRRCDRTVGILVSIEPSISFSAVPTVWLQKEPNCHLLCLEVGIHMRTVQVPTCCILQHAAFCM